MSEIEKVILSLEALQKVNNIVWSKSKKCICTDKIDMQFLKENIDLIDYMEQNNIKAFCDVNITAFMFFMEELEDEAI